MYINQDIECQASEMKKGLNDPMRAQRHTVSPPDQEKLMSEPPPSQNSKMN